MKRIVDPAEIRVADGLAIAGIAFVHELENPEQRFDFYLPDYKLYIECKQFSTPRTAEQIKDREDIIVVQGKHAAEAFARMLVRP